MTYQAPINEGDRLIMTISLFHIFFFSALMLGMTINKSNSSNVSNHP